MCHLWLILVHRHRFALYLERLPKTFLRLGAACVSSGAEPLDTIHEFHVLVTP